jgi:hypothetical protein
MRRRSGSIAKQFPKSAFLAGTAMIAMFAVIANSSRLPSVGLKTQK